VVLAGIDRRVLLPEDFLTRGTLVRGLSYADMGALDIFEGTVGVTVDSFDLATDL
jgi:hypothetical protein